MKKLLLIFLFFCQLLTAQVIHTISFDRFSHYDPDDWITYAYAGYISSIDVGTENVYLATNGGGILRYNLYENRWLSPLTTSNGLSSNRVKEVIFDFNSGQLYARTNSGIDVYNRAFGFFESTSSPMPARRVPDSWNEDIEGFRFPPFSRPSTREWPNLFTGNSYELMLDGVILDPYNYEYKVTDRVVDNMYRMWIGTNGAGVGKADLNMMQLEFIIRSIPSIRPRDVYFDYNDTWIGGKPVIQNQQGISRWQHETDSWNYFKAGLISNIFSDDITVIDGTSNYIFFGTEQGLLEYNKKSDSWKNLQRLNPLKSDEIIDLHVLNEILYIATTNGVFSFDPETESADFIEKNYFHQTKVNRIVSSDSLLFIATKSGIYQYSPQASFTKRIKSRAAIADNFIEALGFSNDTLWFAGATGIGYFDMINDTWKSFPALELPAGIHVNDIAFTPQNVWFATNEGLLKYNRSGDYWYLFTTADGLAHNRIFRIDVDTDTLWLSTAEGVTLFRWFSETRIE